jgi:hypothetical protein
MPANEDRNWETACQQLSIRFADAVDRWDYDPVISLFVPDGALNRWGTRIVGQAALREWLNSRPREVVTRHVCTNIQVTRETLVRRAA